MNTYEFKIHLDLLPSQPIYRYIDCEDREVETNLTKIINGGILVDDENYKNVFIPGHRIHHIDVNFLEKVQTIPDVTETIKSVLKEKD